MTETRAFRFGLVAGRPASAADWLDTARRAEAAGYDVLLLPDTLFTPSPFPALAAAAAVTTRIHVGTWVLAAPMRTAGSVVRDTAALQLLADGRFELGMGAGRPDAAREAERLGVQWGSGPARIRQMIEAIDAVRAEVRPVPRVTVAAGGPRMLAAAAAADTIALALPPAATVDVVERMAESARGGGGDPELALQLSGVGGRLVGYLARSVTAEDMAGAAGVLDGDAAAMAATLRGLRETTGVSMFPVAAEHLDAFAAVIPLLR